MGQARRELEVQTLTVEHVRHLQETHRNLLKRVLNVELLMKQHQIPPTEEAKQVRRVLHEDLGSIGYER